MQGYVAVCGDRSLPSSKRIGGSEGLKIAPDLASFRAMISRALPVAMTIEVCRLTAERFDLVQELRDRYPGVPCIVVAHQSCEEMAIAALRAGANEYLHGPVSPETICRVAERLTSSPVCNGNEQRIVGEHAFTRRMILYLDRLSAADSTVLITGETGTGKELAARHIHANGARRDKPFVSVNCAAVPDTLLESELFGHERGAYTGANATANGKFQHADGGTLFLDEIADMSQFSQAKILRVLESAEVWRLGGSKGMSVNVRIIAATNQDVERLVDERKFRKDLYYRLNVARLRLPPLRDRRSDVPHLVDHYVRVMNHKFGRSVTGFNEESMESLKSHDWPGNVRELRNIVEAAFVELKAGRTSLAELPASLRERLQGAAHDSDSEQEKLLETLREVRWNVSRAASRLHVSRMTLYRKITKYGLSRDT
jgi:DNA-binding NtrC family response regulator